MSNMKERKQRSKQVAAEIEEVLLAESRNQRTGAVDALTDAALFFEDKSGALPSAGPRMTRKKLAQMKTLRVEQLLQRSSFVPPVPLRAKAKKERTTDGGLRKYQSPHEKALAKSSNSAPLANSKKASKASRDMVYDVWGGSSASGAAKNKQGQVEDSEKVKLKKAAIPLCLPGQSFNPDFEAHQDALGIAVGKEMDKELASELFPVVPPAVLGKINSIEAGLLEECYEEDESDEGDDEKADRTMEDRKSAPSRRGDKLSKLTRAQRNKQERHKESLRRQKEAKELKRKSTELDRIRSYQKEIAEEEREKEIKRQRREQSRTERRQELPRRLGKQKFEPEPMQVLLSEEVDGSLRRLKGNAMLIRDRFKSAQERELIEPRRPVRKRKRRVKEYTPGSAGRREEETYRELLRERALRQAAQASLDVFD